MKDIDRFITLIANLEPVEFMGLARVLKVKLFKDEETREPRVFEDVFEEVLEKFTKCDRTRKREILKLIKAAAKRAPGEKKNAGNT
jgi:hypothetical protein